MKIFRQCITYSLKNYQSKTILHSTEPRFLFLTSEQYKWSLDKSRIPTLDEKDLEEKFLKGSGPGGQSVNKTSNACFLRHLPTGITVKCHEFRSLESNRQRAREMIITELDNLFNGEDSIEAQRERRAKEKNIKNEQKRRKLQEMKKKFKEEINKPL